MTMFYLEYLRFVALHKIFSLALAFGFCCSSLEVSVGSSYWNQGGLVDMTVDLSIEVPTLVTIISSKLKLLVHS